MLRVVLPLLLLAPLAGAAADLWIPDPPAEAFDTYGVAVADLFGDGPVMVMQGDDSRLHWVDQDGQWGQATTRHPGNRTTWHTQTLNGVSVLDLDDDGALDVAVLNTGGYLTRFEAADGTLVERWNLSLYPPDRAASFYEYHDWEERLPAEARSHIAHGHPVMGPPRIGEAPWIFTVMDDLSGGYAVDADGDVQWASYWYDAHAGPWLGRLTPFEQPTLLVATDGGEVLAFEAVNGGLRWRFTVPDDVRPGSISVPPTVADLDGDGDMEMFVAARVAVDDHSEDWMTRQHARLFLLDHTGRELWNTSHPDGSPLVHSEALPFDVDGDGMKDLVVLDWNTIGRHPGNFERLGPGHLFALDGHDGRVLWSVDVDAPSTDFRLAALQTDAPLIVVPHDQDGPGIATFDMRDGNLTDWTALPAGWNATRGATLVQTAAGVQAWVRVHRDATTCIPKDDIGCRQGAVAVFDMGPATILAPGHDARAFTAPAPGPPVTPHTGTPAPLWVAVLALALLVLPARRR